MEPPGTAPGSDPLIACAFIAIFPLPGQAEYGAGRGARQPPRGALTGRGDAATCAGRRGRLAQLVERFVYTEEAAGSKPAPPTTFPST